MRVHLPSSCGYFRPGFSVFDTFWAALAPLLALYVRGAYILSADGAATAALYCGISFVIALIAISRVPLARSVIAIFLGARCLQYIEGIICRGADDRGCSFYFHAP